MTSQRTILIIEDDPAIRRGVADAVRFAGHVPIDCGRGDEGLEQALALALDLVVLDVMLPGRNGLEVLAEIRRCKPALPVILVTARGAEAERIEGLELGADDYVVKPFSAKELLARVGAVLRRSPSRPVDLEGSSFELGGRTVDFERAELRRPDGTTSELSEREVEFLRYLCRNPGRVISRDEILRAVWGLDPEGLRHSRTIDMHVARLREKLADDPRDPQLIATVRGKGYKICTEAAT